MQMASMNSSLFSAYPIALIGKGESQEDAPFSITRFVSCCESGISYSNILFCQLWHFGFIFCRSLLFMVLVYCIAGLKGCN